MNCPYFLDNPVEWGFPYHHSISLDQMAQEAHPTKTVWPLHLAKVTDGLIDGTSNLRKGQVFALREVSFC